MAKSKKKNTRFTPPINQPRDASSNQIDQAKKIFEESEKELEVQGVEPTVVPAIATEATQSSLVKANQEAISAKLNYEKVKDRLNDDRSKLEKEKDEIAKEFEEISNRAEDLKVQRSGFETDLLHIQKEKEELVTLRAQAEVGFLTRRDEILGPIQERIADLTTAWNEGELSRIKDWSEKLKEQRDSLELDHKSRNQILKEEENRVAKLELDLSKKERVVEKKLGELTLREESLKEEIEEFEIIRDRLIDETKKEMEAELQDRTDANKRLSDRIADLQKKIVMVDEITKKIGQDPTRLLSEHEELSTRVRILEDELSQRPGLEIRDELSATRQIAGDAVKDKNESLRLQRQLESQLDFQTAQLENLEQLKLTKETLEVSVGAYKEEIKSFRDQLGQLQADRESKTAFPECTRIDLEFEKKSANEGLPVGDLEEFIEDLQSRMALDKDAAADGKQLNYRASDLRIFLAGLAMSKLHLLEGVSGTGKTTLPNAFANALGGSARKVEVQAGWRDKQDLLGYYNSFERVYRETPCLQYLYKAGIPFFSDQLIFIVLDEMNLSHPEQYFADFLSALEDPRSQPLISISDRGLPEVPQGMVKTTGVQLKLPPNVWFIGTANQDETTFAFAPKTYDRAHVMELKPNAPVVSPKVIPERKGYISVKALMESFDAASTDYADQTRKIQGYVHELSTIFKEKFRVSWGNRLALHISRFAPVDIAAGGSVGEALDYIIATKVLQKVKGKHSIRVDDLEELRDFIQGTWIDNLSNHGPVRSLEVIEDEIKELRLG